MRSKLFVLSTLVLLVTLVLSACGSSATTEAAPEVATEAPEVEETTAPVEEPADEGPLPAVIAFPAEIAGGSPVEITVVQKPADSQPEAVEAWEAQVARFQEMYPNVTITGTDYAYTPDSFAALVAGNQVPTLFEVYLTDPGKMIEQGVAADLTSIFEAQNLDQVFNPDIMSIATQDGRVYGIPRFAYAMGLAYNISMLNAAGYDAPPATWEELAVMAQALTDRDAGVAGFSFITDGSGAAGWHMTTIAYNFGLLNTDIVRQSDTGYAAGFSEGPMLEALQFVYDLRWTYDVLPRENLNWGTNGEALATGRAAMVVMAGDQFTWIRQTYPDAPIDDYGFAPLPAGPNGTSVSLVGGNIAMVSAQATPEQVEAAVYWRLFTQFDPDEIVANFESGASNPTVVVGAPTLPLYVGDYEAALEALQAQYANLPVANYQLFLDAISSGQASMQPEPLIAGQDFYSALGAVVSTVVNDQSADPAAILLQTADTFQTNVLDQLR
ncbi:MAG: extracellular solute-binding protein [Anaerolineales bacterium]|nr:extracellular solute-binding protein [Anaerolineales bacterium]